MRRYEPLQQLRQRSGGGDVGRHRRMRHHHHRLGTQSARQEGKWAVGLWLGRQMGPRGEGRSGAKGTAAAADTLGWHHVPVVFADQTPSTRVNPDAAPVGLPGMWSSLRPDFGAGPSLGGLGAQSLCPAAMHLCARQLQQV